MYDVVTLGEGLLRLCPPGHERIRRARSFDVQVCGSQGNVACNLARLGMKTAFITQGPDNALGLLLRDHYLSCGVDGAHIRLVEGTRLGVTYVGFGATPRPSAVVYDRRNSAASMMIPDDFNWSEILKGVRLAYTDGIFPALSPSCRDTCEAFLAAARAQGCHVGFDLNYRNHLWSPLEVCRTLEPFLKQVDILITGFWSAETVFGLDGSEEDVIRRLHDRLGCPTIGMTLRPVGDVLRGTWNAIALSAGTVVRGDPMPVEMVDRFGAGDAWGAGFLFGCMTKGDPQYAVNFANAFCALQQTMPGDVCHATVQEVEALMKTRNFCEQR